MSENSEHAQEILDEVYGLLDVDVLDTLFGADPEPVGFLALDERLNEIAKTAHEFTNFELSCYLRYTGKFEEELPSRSSLFQVACAKMLETMTFQEMKSDLMYGMIPKDDE